MNELLINLNIWKESLGKSLIVLYCTLVATGFYLGIPYWATFRLSQKWVGVSTRPAREHTFFTSNSYLECTVSQEPNRIVGMNLRRNVSAIHYSFVFGIPQVGTAATNQYGCCSRTSIAILVAKKRPRFSSEITVLNKFNHSSPCIGRWLTLISVSLSTCLRYLVEKLHTQHNPWGRLRRNQLPVLFILTPILRQQWRPCSSTSTKKHRRQNSFSNNSFFVPHGSGCHQRWKIILWIILWVVGASTESSARKTSKFSVH